MITLRLARHAMNTRFELLLHGESEAHLRAAGEEALAEIQRLEDRLSLFRPTSEIARLNRHAADGPVKVSPLVFALLRQAQELATATDGAFDPTIGPLMRAWGFHGGRGILPDPAVLAAARACVGMANVYFDETDFTVRFARPGVTLDLGAIGKGYAIDCAVECLREAGVTSAFVHGGTSSCHGLGTMPEGRLWTTGVFEPPSADAVKTEPPRIAEETLLAEVALRDESLGVSAIWGRAFCAGGQMFGHVLDPRAGEPVQRAALAAVALPSATESDALSTALLVLGEPGLETLARLRPKLRALVLLPAADVETHRCVSRGIDLCSHAA